VKGNRTAGRALAVLLVLGLASAARAGPGDGIRLGGSTSRLHPYFELEGRYDSNIAYTAQAQATGGFILHLRPGLTFDSTSDPAAVSLKADLDWAQYFGENSGLSRLYGGAELGVGLYRQGTVGLELSDTFRRSSSTQVFTLGGAVISNSNVLDVSVPWRPGGGAFITTLSGGWDLETYEPFVSGALCPGTSPQCNPSTVAQQNYSEASGKLDVRWKFFPRTAALVQGEYWKRFPSSDQGSKATGGRAWAGAAGLFTTHVAGTLKGGYGGVSDTGGSISTWLANFEGEWLPLETTSLKLGYLHDVDSDPSQDSGYTTHRAYLDARALLSARYTGLLSGSYEHHDYPLSNFSADLFTIEPSVDVEVNRWLRAGGGLAYTKRTSALPAPSANLPGYNYNKTEVYLRVRGTY